MVGTVIGSLITARLMVRMTHYMRVPMAGLLLPSQCLSFSLPIRRGER